MRLVILESPYACKTPGLGYHARAMKVQENIGYARACLRDSLLRGEAPIASHLLYTQSGVLDDDVEAERKMGIEAGLAWGARADASVFYLDYGFSSGMGLGLQRAHRERRDIEFRALGKLCVKLIVDTSPGWEYPYLPGENKAALWLRGVFTHETLKDLATAVKDSLMHNHGVRFEIEKVKP